jgi:hypothetical protein
MEVVWQSDVDRKCVALLHSLLPSSLSCHHRSCSTMSKPSKALLDLEHAGMAPPSVLHDMLVVVSLTTLCSRDPACHNNSGIITCFNITTNINNNNATTANSYDIHVARSKRTIQTNQARTIISTEPSQRLPAINGQSQL